MISKIRQLYAWVDEIYQRANEINLNIYIHEELAKTQLAATLLEKLLKPGPYMPITSSSLNLFSMLQVINDAAVNKRQCYLEFGAGLSTLLMARLKKLNELDITLVSVESDENWHKTVHQFLAKEGLEYEVVQVLAQLEPTKLSWNQQPIDWYAVRPIEKVLSEVPAPDLVLVDGPAAYKDKIAYSRYPAFPFLKDKLAESYCIFLDDVNREGEWKILQQWAETADLKPIKLSGTFGTMSKNPALNAFY
jgi:hypothetical protein